MKQLNNDLYEILPDGTLFLTHHIRSMMEVLQERTKVAIWFCPDTSKAKILTGSCTIFKNSLSLQKNRLILEDVKDLPVSVKLQDMIDVYNNLTAEEVIENYKKNLKKRSSQI